MLNQELVFYTIYYNNIIGTSMKRFSTMLVAGLLATSAFGQSNQPSSRRAVLSPEKANVTVSYQSRIEQVNLSAAEHQFVRATQLPTEAPNFSPTGKVAAVNPIPLGSGTNIFTILRTEQNQVIAVDSLDMVAFIHRNDAGTFGGSSGNLRYDFSIDGGATWTLDVGEINPNLTRPARYPNMTAFNNSGTSNPNMAGLVYSAPTLATSWDGHVDGYWGIGATSGGTENYSLLSSGTFLQGGLCQGLPNEFWSVEFKWDGSAVLGELYVNKGTFNITTSDVDWVRKDTMNPNHFTGFDNASHQVGPNIAFSPDGMTGWIVWLGDLQGGEDTLYTPIFVKSTDGGDTWGAPAEFDFTSIPWVYDSLRTLWTDSMNNIVSSGAASCAFDFDLTVDKDGNPHVFTAVCSRSSATQTSGYSVLSGLAKFMADIYSTDGGATWSMNYVSPLLTFRTPDYGTTTTVNMDNYPQIARNSAGTMIFYSWADSDTAQFTGSMNGVGFGESANLAPNLRTAALRLSTGEQTYPNLVSDGDLTWEGRMLYPTMSPEVIWNGSTWELPIVIAEMVNNDPLQQTRFHYFGKDATIDPSSFCLPTSMKLSWDLFSAGSTPPCAVNVDNSDLTSNIVLGQSYPNPTAGEAVITFELPAVTNLTMNVRNMYGQEVAVVAQGEFNAGSHKVTVNTSDLAAGVYFYSLTANGKSITKKMIVTK